MVGIFRSLKSNLKRAFTSKVLQRVDIKITKIGTGTISLRLMRDPSMESDYVVLLANQGNDLQQFEFELDEFDRLIQAAREIRAAAQSTTSTG